MLCNKASQNIKHEYHATINVNNGDIYLDCRKRKIFVKHVALLIARPIYTCIKTLYHASIIAPIAFETFRYLKGLQSKDDTKKHIYESFQDIIRTPLYGLAITITHIFGIILGVLNPNSLYKTREIAGDLERRLLRVNSILKSGISLSPCFSPCRNLLKNCEGTLLTKDEREMMLIKFAAAQVNDRQKNRRPFNDCCFLFPNDRTFISAAKPAACP